MAAFAVTATGVHAYTGPKLFEKAGLNEEQISAFAMARELRETGNINGARDVLLRAGIDDEVLLKVQRVTRENREAIETAIENRDYSAFSEAIMGTALATRAPTEDDFNRLLEVRTQSDEKRIFVPRHEKHQLFTQLTDEQQEAITVAKQANDREAVKAILAEAGITPPGKR